VTNFKDHFSGHAADYARARPTYPAALFSYLAELAPTRGLTWDCGTGNGQAARGLAEHFARVVATDASADQIANAAPHPRISYRVAPAEDSGLETASIDLVTAAQALHWFDIDRFFAECNRVLLPGGILATITYRLTEVNPEIDPIVEHLADEVVGPYWPPEAALVEEEYRSIVLPFPELTPPTLEMAVDWDLTAFVSYLGTWSAVHRYRAATGTDPLAMVWPQLSAAWRQGSRRVHWPLSVRVCRKPSGNVTT